MINAQSLKHPATQNRIIDGLIVANDNAMKAADGRGVAYVNNAKGSPMFRLDVYTESGKPCRVVAWRGNREMQRDIAAAIGSPLVDLL